MKTKSWGTIALMISIVFTGLILWQSHNVNLTSGDAFIITIGLVIIMGLGLHAVYSSSRCPNHVDVKSEVEG